VEKGSKQKGCFISEHGYYDVIYMSEKEKSVKMKVIVTYEGIIDTADGIV
jgi:prophage antirepressor-like protein